MIAKISLRALRGRPRRRSQSLMVDIRSDETGFILPLQNGWKRVASAVEAVAYGATQWGRRASIIFGDDERSKRGEEEVFPHVGRKRQTRANAAVYRKFPAQRDRKRAK